MTSFPAYQTVNRRLIHHIRSKAITKHNLSVAPEFALDAVADTAGTSLTVTGC